MALDVTTDRSATVYTPVMCQLSVGYICKEKILPVPPLQKEGIYKLKDGRNILFPLCKGGLRGI